MSHQKTLLESNILKNLNIEQLNPMQIATIDAFRKHKELILLSPTGSGKTVGFLLPAIETIDTNNKNVQVLILAPSRELALQIEGVFKKMQTGIKVNCCYGGHAIRTEIKNLSEPPPLLIGTPGRIDDLCRRGHLDLTHVKTIILDEFDKSLEFGFQSEMSYILGKLAHLNKTILTSATELTIFPEFLKLTTPFKLDFLEEHLSTSNLEIRKVISEDKDKLTTLLQLICKLGNQSMLVFLNHREAVERVSGFLDENQIDHAIFHGGLEQSYRERTIAKFRNQSCNILITTDLAARGLDIPEIKIVIHYQLPLKQDAFTHRNGRTARMNADGTVYLILSRDERTPDFISPDLPIEELSEHLQLPEKPEWETLYIGKGKKDKINKIDIVGFLHNKGGLEKSDIGMIEVKDDFAYVAIKRKKIHQLIRTVKDEKIKNLKVKMEIAM